MFPFVWDHFKTEHQAPVLGLSRLRASVQWGDREHPICWQCSGTDHVSSSPLEKAGHGLSYPQYCAKVGAKKASIHNYFKNNAEFSHSSSNVFFFFPPRLGMLYYAAAAASISAHFQTACSQLFLHSDLGNSAFCQENVVVQTERG